VHAFVFKPPSFSTSQNGVLVYRSATSENLQAVWCDRQGKRVATVGEPRAYRQFTLSPDEKRIAAHMAGPNNKDDIWLLDLTSGILSRVTSDPGRVDGAVWSPDGRELIFSSSRGGLPNLYRKIVGGGDDRLILKSGESNYAEQWLKDGSLLFLNDGGKSFLRLQYGADAKPETLLKTEYNKDEPRVSPDGRWVAYNSLESGRWEVYVASFPAFADRRQVSGNGGVQGYWAKNGKELFYLALDGTMMFVPIKPGERLETAVPQILFQTRVPVFPTRDQFAVTNDGQRFLLVEPIETETKPLTVVVNWPVAAKN
jgi:Tol biopolymer transport system component